jgi:hypothetical protein
VPAIVHYGRSGIPNSAPIANRSNSFPLSSKIQTERGRSSFATKPNRRRPRTAMFLRPKGCLNERKITKLYNFRNVPVHLLHQVGS